VCEAYWKIRSLRRCTRPGPELEKKKKDSKAVYDSTVLCQTSCPGTLLHYDLALELSTPKLVVHSAVEHGHREREIRCATRRQRKCWLVVQIVSRREKSRNTKKQSRHTRDAPSQLAHNEERIEPFCSFSVSMTHSNKEWKSDGFTYIRTSTHCEHESAKKRTRERGKHLAGRSCSPQ